MRDIIRPWLEEGIIGEVQVTEEVADGDTGSALVHMVLDTV